MGRSRFQSHLKHRSMGTTAMHVDIFLGEEYVIGPNGTRMGRVNNVRCNSSIEIAPSMNFLK